MELNGNVPALRALLRDSHVTDRGGGERAKRDTYSINKRM
jgi:hypothetical protein